LCNKLASFTRLYRDLRSTKHKICSVMRNVTMDRQAKVVHVFYRNAVQQRKKEKRKWDSASKTILYIWLQVVAIKELDWPSLHQMEELYDRCVLRHVTIYFVKLTLGFNLFCGCSTSLFDTALLICVEICGGKKCAQNFQQEYFKGQDLLDTIKFSWNDGQVRQFLSFWIEAVISPNTGFPRILPPTKTSKVNAFWRH
jgi:hypothetical protein